jgi:hypothetical protein
MSFGDFRKALIEAREKMERAGEFTDKAQADVVVAYREAALLLADAINKFTHIIEGEHISEEAVTRDITDIIRQSRELVFDIDSNFGSYLAGLFAEAQTSPAAYERSLSLLDRVLRVPRERKAALSSCVETSYSIFRLLEIYRATKDDEKNGFTVFYSTVLTEDTPEARLLGMIDDLSSKDLPVFDIVGKLRLFLMKEYTGYSEFGKMPPPATPSSDGSGVSPEEVRSEPTSLEDVLTAT